MSTAKVSKYWILGIVLLIAIIATSSVIIFLKYPRSQPIEISMPPPAQEMQGEIYVGGAVNIPGFYPLNYDDN